MLFFRALMLHIIAKVDGDYKSLSLCLLYASHWEWVESFVVTIFSTGPVLIQRAPNDLLSFMNRSSQSSCVTIKEEVFNAQYLFLKS